MYNTKLQWFATFVKRNYTNKNEHYFYNRHSSRLTIIKRLP